MSHPPGGLTLPHEPDARTRLTAIAVLLSLVAGLVSLAFVAAAPAHADTFHVSIKNFSFNPQDLNIPVGSTVQWSNDETDGSVHSATADDGTFTQDLNPGDTFSFTFTKAGTYGVHCRFHTYITGTITVTDSSGSTTSTTAAPSTTSTTAPSSTTSTTEPSTTSTTAPSTTSTTAPPSTTSTTAPPSTTSTTAPPDDTIIGGTVIPPVDGALTSAFDAMHSALVSLDDALAGASSGSS